MPMNDYSDTESIILSACGRTALFCCCKGIVCQDIVHVLQYRERLLFLSFYLKMQPFEIFKSDSIVKNPQLQRD